MKTLIRTALFAGISGLLIALAQIGYIYITGNVTGKITAQAITLVDCEAWENDGHCEVKNEKSFVWDLGENIVQGSIFRLNLTLKNNAEIEIPLCFTYEGKLPENVSLELPKRIVIKPEEE